MLERRKNSPVRDDIENDVYQILADNYLQKKDIKNHDHYQDLYLKRVAETNQDAAMWVNKLIVQEKLYNKTEKEIIFNKYIYLIISATVFFLSVIIYLLVKQLKIKQKRNLLEKQVLDLL